MDLFVGDNELFVCAAGGAFRLKLLTATLLSPCSSPVASNPFNSETIFPEDGALEDVCGMIANKRSPLAQSAIDIVVLNQKLELILVKLWRTFLTRLNIVGSSRMGMATLTTALS